MFIESLVLVDCRRLLLRNISRFEITFNSTWQSIIGCNGSGKTTVMRHLSPMKAESNQFLKTGSKTIIFRHKGKRYKSTSHFANGSHHELWDLEQNVNLNPGRTGAVHSQLVMQLFGLNKELFDILVGKFLFAQMSNQKRQEWLMDMSQMDMSFAMTIFQRLKTRLADSKAVEKHLTKRLADEIAKLPSENELDGLEEECEHLTENLNALLTERINRFPSPAETKKTLDSIMLRCQQVSLQLLKLTAPKTTTQYKTLTDVEVAIGRLEQRLESIKGELHSLYQQHEETSTVFRTLEGANVKGVSALAEKNQALKAEREALLKRCYRFTITEEAELISQHSHVALPLLMELLEEIPVNVDLRFSKMDNQTLRLQIEKTQQALNYAVKQADKLTDELHHQHDQEVLDCPQCKHQWIRGQSPQEVERRENQLTEWITKKEKLETDCRSLESLEADQHRYQVYLRRLNQLVKQNPSMRLLWDAVTEDWKQGQQPKQIIQLLSTWKLDLALALQAAELEKTIKEQERVLVSVEQSHEGTSQRYQQLLQRLDDQINTLLESQAAFQKDLQQHTAYRAVIVQFEKLNKELQNLLTEGDTALGQHTKAIEQEMIGNLITENQALLAKASQLLQTASQAKAVIDDISKGKEEARKQTEALAILVQELSPVDGLIAEQLSYFITQFVHHLNEAIDRVWTYSLKVLTCGKESGELTYRFPVEIHGSPDTADDIGDVSSSQVDMINFAFRLVVMKYKNMTDWPLYLDELAPSLDEQHRLNIVEFVKYLMETHKCSQLFMISHYMYTNSALTRAEVCVMDEHNILTLPSVYNKHVSMH